MSAADRSLARAALDETERATVARLVALLERELGPDLRAVWLYGSRARGVRSGPESDVDLLIVADGGWDRHEQRAIQLLNEAASAAGADPTWFSVKTFDPDWIEGRRAIGSFFIREVDRDKLVLSGSP